MRSRAKRVSQEGDGRVTGCRPLHLGRVVDVNPFSGVGLIVAGPGVTAVPFSLDRLGWRPKVGQMVAYACDDMGVITTVEPMRMK
jgi:hypothetical protein